ncbi:MAG: OB-fold nucleic acid binding domain-containing protein [Bowdeniella nasicola]|nr:OB-fold nucleic acid binding domain-containing protein [Bowdeniella nasicola]
MTYRAAGKNPRLIARLTDETGSVDLIFQGQRTIRGIEPGRALIATGTVFDDGGAPVMFNPEYRLLPAREEYAS